MLADRCGPEVQFVALDIDREAVGAAQVSQPDTNGIVGNGMALPLRDACCTAVFCIAALGLFANAAIALDEMHRVLHPDGRVFIATATQLWAPVTHWPEALATAYEQALMAGHPPLSATADLQEYSSQLLHQAGFAAPQIRAFLLAPSIRPSQAELALFSWNDVRLLITPYLSHTNLQHCEHATESVEIELCTVVLVTEAIK
ncbi:MAG: hypothetical protein GFH27_549409n26 [Chloroflexi bacterium AL-W]|nr:hypothetical protein [Chloroflexi bacterium AL-N1]NOK71361.1 hypothetical protein [Chloroflexi bacterium AL-N10]NOK78764.1 hypothetical protein [Chloroflexi bacterium AL-N5]NOK86134.1 hypothetical protein [Chloroflexi bacterium AL-W]NOK93087.1 hypothetical protein [Chloroflexi bacterium AL-N15]